MEAENGISRGKAIVKSGKLIRVDAIFRDGKIEKIKITGDFFLHPEDKIEELENSLEGREITQVKNIAQEVLKDAEYVGISAETIADAVREAWKNRR